jgi:hypothetical protein
LRRKAIRRPETLTIGSQRPLFDVPAGSACFNSAYNSPRLKHLAGRARRGRAGAESSAKRPPADFFADAERIRELTASLFALQSQQQIARTQKLLNCLGWPGKLTGLPTDFADARGAARPA